MLLLLLLLFGFSVVAFAARPVVLAYPMMTILRPLMKPIFDSTELMGGLMIERDEKRFVIDSFAYACLILNEEAKQVVVLF